MLFKDDELVDMGEKLKTKEVKIANQELEIARLKAEISEYKAQRTNSHD